VKDGKGPVAVALLALLGACVASFVIGTPAGSRRGPDAAKALLDAWRANRMATYVAEYQFTRTFPDGNHLEQRTLTVQQPPDNRIVSGLGTVAGRLGGKIVSCASAPDGSSRCFTSVNAPLYTDEVDREIASLADYVLGPRPLYVVVDFVDGPGDCFRLDRVLAVPSPPYGDHALFCFDPLTRVKTLTVIERVEATDREQATAWRTTVTADDVKIPTDMGQVIGVPGPTTTTASTTTPSTTSPPTTVPAPTTSSGG